jgi:hypothetical protein
VSDAIREGTFIVGKDIKAGTYKTDVPETSTGCYWERAKDSTGNGSSTIANDNLSAGAHGTVTIKNGETFKTDDCGTWTLHS